MYSRARGIWLVWPSIELLRCLSVELVPPLPDEIGCYRYRTGFVARRSAEDLPPFLALTQAVSEIALGQNP